MLLLPRSLLGLRFEQAANRCGVADFLVDKFLVTQFHFADVVEIVHHRAE